MRGTCVGKSGKTRCKTKDYARTSHSERDTRIAFHEAPHLRTPEPRPASKSKLICSGCNVRGALILLEKGVAVLWLDTKMRAFECSARDTQRLQQRQVAKGCRSARGGR